jgi:uncharacterized membrane protein
MSNYPNQIVSNHQIRLLSREQLQGNWGKVVLLCLVAILITGTLGGISRIGPGISLLISGPLNLGIVACFLKLIRKEEFRFENLFDGFKNLASALILNILICVFVFLGFLLLIVPGIIVAYSFSMAYYILSDQPGIGAMEALSRSKKMMMGYKWKLFTLHFSFIGWAILSILTLGIGLFWLIPYIKTATANFYENLKNISIDPPEEKNEGENTEEVL